MNLGNGDVAPPKYGVQKHCPRKFVKFNFKICADLSAYSNCNILCTV